MTPFVPHSTLRTKIVYKSNGGTHSVQFRTSRPDLPPAGFTNRLNDFLGAVFSNSCPNDAATLSGSYAPVGTDIFLPWSEFNPINNGVSTLLPVERLSPYQMTFVGRSAGGRRAKLTIFGPIGLVEPVDPAPAAIYNDWRITAAENGGVSSMIAALVAMNLIAVDGLSILWYPYVNLSYNAYYTRKKRRGA